MIFMKVIEANGLLAELTQGLIALLGPVAGLLLLVALTVVIMFPGMITGSCTASVLGTGAIVAPVLHADGAAARDGGRGDLERGGLRHDRAAGERPGDDHRRRHRHAVRRLRPGADACSPSSRRS